MTTMIEGGCFCGQVRYRVNAPLKTARSCHCSRCRKAFSGAGSAYADLEPGSLTWLQGEALLTNFPPDQEWGRSFCSRCGTSICGTFRGEPHGVVLGSVDGDPGVAIGMHIFVGSKAPWDHIGGDAPQHVAFPPGL